MPKKDSHGKISSYIVVREDISESFLLKKSLHDALDLKMDPLT